MDLRPPGNLRVAELERGVEDPRRPQSGVLARDHVSAANRIDTDPGEVDRHALPGARTVDGGVVHLGAPNPGALPGRQQRDAVAGAKRPDQSVPVTTVPAPST